MSSFFTKITFASYYFENQKYIVESYLLALKCCKVTYFLGQFAPILSNKEET